MKLKTNLILSAMGQRLFYSLSACFLCAFAFLPNAGQSDSASPDILQSPSHFALGDPSPARSVWKIIQDNWASGTAFAVGPNRFVTNFHVVFNMMLSSQDMENVFLRQRERESPLVVRRMLAVSPRCDLALLETAGHVSEWLQTVETPPSVGDSLALWSRDKKGQPERILGVGGLNCDDHECFFPTDHIISKGTSGSPVLSSAGEVAAVISSSAENFVYVRKADCLKHFLESSVGLSCAGLSWDSCMRRSFQPLSLDEAYDQYIWYQVMEMQGDFWAPGEPAIAEGFYKRAFSFAQASARAGLSSAQNALAVFYRKGKGVLKDDTKAAYWYEEAAKRGDPLAQSNWAHMLYYAEGGVSQDEEEAFLWYHRAALQGLSSAQFQLALMYSDGEGVLQDSSKVLDWYRRAGDHGHAEARYMLMDIYYRGDGVEQDKDQAFYWGLLAALQGNPFAQLHIGSLYEKGEGTEKNLSEAVRWYRESALQGLPASQYRFALMAEEGRGMEQNIPLALIYYEEAALQGHKLAQSRWDALTNLQG